MRLKIVHTTRYTFDSEVEFGLQQVRKTPKSTDLQTILNWSVTVEGGKIELSYDDHFNNHLDLISIDRGTRELVTTCTGEVEMTTWGAGVIGHHRGPAPLWLFHKATPLTQSGPGLRVLARKVTGDTELDRLHSAMDLIKDAVAYEVGASETHWTAETVLEEGRGVCQDHAHVFIALAREMGFPARYVSGYLMLNDRVDQVAMHAWAEVHVSDLGWVGFDVPNGICPDERYVRVATGLDYAGAAPVTGSRIGGTGEALDVAIEVAEQ